MTLEERAAKYLFIIKYALPSHMEPGKEFTKMAVDGLSSCIKDLGKFLETASKEDAARYQGLIENAYNHLARYAAPRFCSPAYCSREAR